MVAKGCRKFGGFVDRPDGCDGSELVVVSDVMADVGDPVEEGLAVDVRAVLK